jgi:hypothetical protein
MLCYECTYAASTLAVVDRLVMMWITLFGVVTFPVITRCGYFMVPKKMQRQRGTHHRIYQLINAKP